VQGRIKSPTYAVVEPHKAGAGDTAWPIWQFDFYRFNDPQEWEDAGFRDVFAAPGLKLCEWPQNAGPALPAPDVVVQLQWTGDNSREVQWRAHSACGEALLA
jgi:tRNA threonylcarbamoyladenosine biosynthesis protein TsaE